MDNVVFIEVMCGKAHKKFYARYDLAFDKKWVLTYGIKYIPPGETTSQFGSRTMKIDISKARNGPQYKCPYCNNNDFVRCGSCGKITCYTGTGISVCEYCGDAGEVTGHIDSLNGKSGRTQV